MINLVTVLRFRGFLLKQHYFLHHNKIHLIIFLLTLLLLFFSSLALMQAQAVDADVDFFALPAENDKPYYVGDRITLRLEVNHPAGSQVDMYPIEEQWGDFEVIDQTKWQTVQNEDGSATTGKDIVVALFEPGQYQTPSLVVEHRKPDGSVEELGAPVIRLTIDSVLEEGDTELRDIKPQATLPVPPIWPLIVAIIAVTLLVLGGVLGGGLWLYHRWRQQGMVTELPLPVIDARPPEVIAYAELDRIERLNLPAHGRMKEHYTLVTDCLRRYIEGRYQIPALDRTTSELREAFRMSSASKDSVRGFINLLMESDLVKFARFLPLREEAYQLINQARELVRVTTPVLEPEAETKEAKPEPEVEILR
jgi:hypothetical protein